MKPWLSARVITTRVITSRVISAPLLIVLLAVGCAPSSDTKLEPYPYPENPWPAAIAPALNPAIHRAETEGIVFRSPPLSAQQTEPALTVLRFLNARKISYGEGPLQKTELNESLSSGLAAAFIEDAAKHLSGDRIYEGPIITYLTNLQLRGNKAIVFTCEDHTKYGVSLTRNDTDPFEIEIGRESAEFGKNESYEFRLIYEKTNWKIISISRIAFPKTCPPL
jgi:hypothetical protein